MVWIGCILNIKRSGNCYSSMTRILYTYNVYLYNIILITISICNIRKTRRNPEYVQK